MPSPFELSKIAGRLYAQAPPVARGMMKYRPYICPFHKLIAHVPDGARVLDVGCGGGLFLNLTAAAAKVEHGVGFDLSEPMTELANRVAKAEGSPVSFGVGNADADWPEGDFNLVTCVDLMHHIPPDRQAAVVDRLMDTVAPGGRLIYKDMARRPRWRAGLNRLHDLTMARQWIHYYPIEAVDEAAARHGLQHVAAESIHMAWYAHELRVYDRPRNNGV